MTITTQNHGAQKQGNLTCIWVINEDNSQIAFLPELTVVYLADMCGFDALPTTKNVGTEQVYQTLWQLLPGEKNLYQKFNRKKYLQTYKQIHK